MILGQLRSGWLLAQPTRKDLGAMIETKSIWKLSFQAVIKSGASIASRKINARKSRAAPGRQLDMLTAVEGALAWIDGMAISAAAENLEGVYAFLDFCFDAAAAGAAIRHHGYNSAVLGADQYAGDSYKKNFQDAYPGNALANLWPWPIEPQWYADLRTQYRNKFVAA